MLARYRRLKQMAADEALLDQYSDAVQINCSVAGLVVLKNAVGQPHPVQLIVGTTILPICIKGWTASGSSGTFQVYGLYA